MFILLSFSLALSLLDLGTLEGVVSDARTGELLSRVRVELVPSGREVQTDDLGHFQLEGVPAGSWTLRLSTVGYRLVQERFDLQPNEQREFRLGLSPDSYQRTDAVTVRADPFQLDEGSGPTGIAIDGNEIKNLASVLMDDPMRAVQSMPGVTANDDFDGRFSLHGAPYERIGLYVDDILLHQPFHTVQGEGPSGSLAAFDGDMVQSLNLEAAGYAPQYGDRTAGVVDLHTRDGSRTQTNARAFASAADAGVLAEGPLGSRRRGSWLASVRKSYLNYIMSRTSSDSNMAFGFLDEEAHLSYDIGRKQVLTLALVDATSKLDRSRWQNQLGLDASMLAGYRFTLANLGWQYAPSSSFFWSNHAAFMRERFDDTNIHGQELAEGYYGEWVANSNATWTWGGAQRLNFGLSVRKIRGNGFEDYYSDGGGRIRTDEHDGGTWLAGGSVQQSFGLLHQRLILSAGTRWDRIAASGTAVTSPQASLALAPWSSGRFQLAWGRYSQFPDVQDLYATTGSPRLAPERATHYVAAFEQRLGQLTRVRLQAYRRDDRDLLFRPQMEARIAGGAIRGDDWEAPILNSMSGTARGVEVFLQRRTANRVTGWVSYAYGFDRMRDTVTGLRFFSDQDQRHTVNTYIGYRLRPSVHLSTRWTYGSGFPLPGYFRKEGDTYYLAPGRNTTRLGPYKRVDFRVNKQRTFERWKMTIYAEVVNLFNAANYRFDSYDGFNPVTGEAYLSLTRMFPILPSAGVMLEW